MPDHAPPEASRTIARRALRSGVWVMLGNYGNQVVGFVAMLLLTRQLDQEIFGTFALATFWMSLLNVRTKLGINYAAVRRGALDGRLLGTYLTLDLLSGLASLLLTAAMIFWLVPTYGAPAGGEASASGFDRDVALALAVMMVGECLLIIPGPFNVVIEREMLLRQATLWSFGGYLAAYVVALAWAVTQGGLWSLLIINLVAYAVGVVGSLLIVRRSLPDVFRWRWRFDRSLAVGLLRDGLSTGLSLALLGVIAAQFDNFLVGTFVSRADLGYYDRAYRLAAWPSVLLTLTISRIAFLTMSRVKDDPERLAHTLRLAFWVITTVGIPMALALSFAAHDVVVVLYGPRWEPSAQYLRYLALASVGASLMSISFWLAAALGRHKMTIALAGCQALLLVTVGTVFTLRWGALGTALAVWINAYLGATIGLLFVRSETRLKFGDLFLFPTLATAVTVAALLLVVNQAPWADLGATVAGAALRMVATGVVIFALYLGFLMLFNRREMLVRIGYLRTAWRAAPG